MDQLAIQMIEGFLDVPLVSPTTINELDAREISAALHRLNSEVCQAKDDAAAAWANPSVIDETNVSRLEEVEGLIREAIDRCETCDGEPCVTCEALGVWLAEE